MKKSLICKHLNISMFHRRSVWGPNGVRLGGFCKVFGLQTQCVLGSIEKLVYLCEKLRAKQWKRKPS